MKPLSEYQSFRALVKGENADVYKACVSVANHGSALADEALLSEEERTLLHVRRLIFLCKFDEAEAELQRHHSTHPFLNGDRLFLLGQLFHKIGRQQEASTYMQQAADQYKLTGDTHRELRARVNGAICVATLESVTFGALYCLEQEARNLNYPDILGNIHRIRAIELLKAGFVLDAHVHALEAVKCYECDGHQDDRGVAVYIAAICCILMGDLTKAIETKSRALTSSGKSEVYRHIYDDLLSGKFPKVHPGHPLSGMDWKKSLIKSESVAGKIVNSLRRNPRTRDELISEVWGENALSQSYCHRLYTAINALRKERGINVMFDGEHYKLG